MLLTSSRPFYLTQSFCGESWKGGFLSTNVVFVIDNNYFAHVWTTSSSKLCNLHVHLAVFTTTTTTTLFYSTNADGVEQIPDTNQQTQQVK